MRIPLRIDAIIGPTAYIMEPISLTNQMYLDQIHDYEHLQMWSYQGNVHAVINFTMKDCESCSTTNALIRDLCVKYGEQIRFYEVQLEDEADLATELGVEHIPNIMFIPMDCEPMVRPCIVNMEIVEKVIQLHLLRGQKQSA